MLRNPHLRNTPQSYHSLAQRSENWYEEKVFIRYSRGKPIAICVESLNPRQKSIYPYLK